MREPMTVIVHRVVHRKYEAVRPGGTGVLSPRHAQPCGYQIYGMPHSELEEIIEEVTEVFTQQHYEAFAREIERSVMSYDAAGDAEGRRVTVEFLNHMCNVFEQDNPKFKKFKFIETALAKANALRSGTT